MPSAWRLEAGRFDPEIALRGPSLRVPRAGAQEASEAIAGPEVGNEAEGARKARRMDERPIGERGEA